MSKSNNFLDLAAVVNYTQIKRERGEKEIECKNYDGCGFVKDLQKARKFLSAKEPECVEEQGLV